jgi:TolB-like protein
MLPWVEQAERDLTTDKHLEDGSIVFRVRSTDGKLGRARTEVHNLGPRHGGYRPGRITEGGGDVYLGDHGDAVELRISAPGYDQFQRRAILRDDQILIWDDIVLAPVQAGSGGTVSGTLWLEGSPNLEGIPIAVNGNAVAFTDGQGRFTLTELPEGDLKISANKSEYLGLSVDVKVGKGASAVCELRGYRRRTALVQWTFQPDGSRSLTGNLPGGTATISPHGLRRISFSKSFGEVTEKSDLFIRQDRSRLLLDAFDARNPDQPGFIQMDGGGFDDLREAPLSGYSGVEKEIIPGAVFACKTYDGQHYGKLEVLRVDGGPSAEAEEPPRSVQRCVLSDIPVAPSGSASLAVIDFDHDDHVAQGTARACADLCRGVVNDSGRFIVVERQSMIHILGEQDFAATVKCDDTRCLVNFGKKLRAQKLLHGRLSKAGNSFVLTIKLLDVSSGMVDALQTKRVQGRVDDLLSAVEPQTCALLRSALTVDP